MMKTSIRLSFLFILVLTQNLSASDNSCQSLLTDSIVINIQDTTLSLQNNLDPQTIHELAQLFLEIERLVSSIDSIKASIAEKLYFDFIEKFLEAQTLGLTQQQWINSLDLVKSLETASKSKKNKRQLREQKTLIPLMPWKVDKILSGHKFYVHAVNYSHDGKLLVSASYDGTAKVWDVSTGHLIHDLIHSLTKHVSVLSAEFSPDSKYVLTIALDNTAKLWSSKSGTMIHSINGDWIKFARFSPDGKFIITSSGFDAIVWDIQNGKEVHVLKGDDLTYSVNFSSSGRYVAIEHPTSAKIWNIKTGELLYTFPMPRKHLNTAGFSPDEKSIVITSQDGTVKISDILTGKVVHVLTSEPGEIMSVDFSPDRKKLITASHNGTVNIWNTETGNLILKIENSPRISFKSAVYSQDGMHIITSSDDSKVKIWDAKTGLLLHSFQHNDKQTTSVRLSPDNKTMAVSNYDSDVFILKRDTSNLNASQVER